jgi:hypothetical protein
VRVLGGWFVLACSASACGARTGLSSGEASETPSDASVDANTDRSLPPFDGGPDGAPDVASETSETGCTSDAQCSDGVECTIDRCDLATGTCSHDPDDGRCPPGFRCLPPAGCVATSFANSEDFMYGVTLPSGTIASIGPTAQTFDDIALRHDGTLYAVSTTALYRIDIVSEKATLVANLAEYLNALDFGPDGTLYGAGPDSPDVYTVDPHTGGLTTIASLPDGYSSSGDLAVVGNALLLSTTRTGQSDSLARIDLTSSAVSIVGTTGYSCIYGLASYRTRLFGFTCDGEVIQIDPTTAASTFLAGPGPMFYGASAR